MKIKNRKYDVMATSEGAANNHTSEIPTALPPPPDKAGESRQDGPGATDPHDVSQNGGGAGTGSMDGGGAQNGDGTQVGGGAGEGANTKDGAVAQNGDGTQNGSGSGSGKKAKRSMKKVSFGFDDVQEIPAREETIEEENGDTIEEAVETDLTDEEAEEGEEVIKSVHKDSDIEFLRKFANLRKLGNVMEERSRKQEAAAREQADSQLARAREILQKRVRRQELARLIPSEELERLLNAVNMQEEFVVSRDDTRKFVITNRGKTSYIFLAGKDGADEQEEEAPVLITQSDETFSQTFGDGAGLL